MRKAFVEQVALPEPRFRDGLGIRYVRASGTDDPVEVLRPLWDVGAMQTAIRQRVSRLQSFRQARFITLRSAEVPRDDPSTIEVVSDFVAGHRLSQYLDAAQAGAIPLSTSAAVYILRELIGALTLLQESRGITHGAVAPERLLITPKGRVVVADYVLGPAIERLDYSRARLWREFRVPVPAGKGHPKLDDKADVMQVGMTAAALLLGRPIEHAEFPDHLDDLLVALGHVHRTSGMEPVPPALVNWVKRAVHEDAGGKFANVAEARLLLESVLSKQDIASGGAAALKSVAERFGRYAADLEARAAAAAAEEARKAALTAQAAAMEAIRIAASDAAEPGNNAVPAFTLLSEAPAGMAPGSSSEIVTEQVPLLAADVDPPVGWRVPEAPPVEDTLPVSPLIQIDAPAAAQTQEEFVEEVLDLTGLAGDDDVGIDAAVAALSDESGTLAVAASDTATGFEMVAAPAPSAEPVMVSEPAPVTEPELVTESSPVTEPVIAAGIPSVVDEILSVLEAEPQPPPEPHGLPEWRLLADPVGAFAPTIDVVEPTETLDELVAEFEATPFVPHASTDTPSTAPELASLAPETTDAAPMAADEQPPAAGAPQQALEALAEPAPTALEVVLGLQEAQAAAQAAAQPPPETAPDLSAWSFVEELVHRDERFAQRTPSETWLPAETAADPRATEVNADSWREPEPVEAPQAVQAPARAEEPDRVAVPDLAQEPELAEEPEPGARVPKLPADWFVEVGRRPQTRPPIEDEVSEPAPAAPWIVAADPVEVLQPARLEAAERVAEAAVVDAPTVRRTVASDSEDAASGPVFPRVAPSVQRVRAEARRRRWARLASAIVGGFSAAAGAVASVGHAAASGVGALVSGIGGVAAGIGRAVVSGVRSVTALFAALGAGVLAAGRAALHTSGTIAHACLSGLLSAARAVGAGAAAAAGGVLAALAAAGRASGALLASLARIAARGATALGTGLISAAATTGRAGATGAAALARGASAALGAAAAGLGRVARASGAGLAKLFVAIATGAGAAGRGSVSAGRAAARATARVAGGVGGALGSAGRVAGHGGAVAGQGLARAAIRVPRRVYFFLSDLADRLPKPVFRPWYLAAALVVIVAVAGVPYAKSWLSTHAPDLRTGLIETVREPVAAEPPKAPVAAAKATGSIRVTVDPAGAEVLLDGMLQGTAPLTIENVSPGSHTLVVRDESGTVRQGVRVSADGVAELSLKIRPGWLAVFAPVKLDVLEDGKPIGSTEGGRILTAPGPHTIELVSQAIGFRETRQVEIKPGEVAALTLQLPPVTVEVAAPAEAEIFVDGQSVGLSPLGPLQIAVGTREFVMRHPTLGERRQTVRVSYTGPARVSFD